MMALRFSMEVMRRPRDYKWDFSIRFRVRYY
jgi:hypothetical protein